MSDQFDRLFDDEDRTRRGNEQIWNLFSQILVPIVILLSFVAVSEITRYQVVTRVIEDRNVQLQEAINDLKHTDVGTMDERYKIQLINAQKQALLHALDQEIAAQRALGQLGLAEFPDKRLVNLSGREIDDAKFAKFCAVFRDKVIGNENQRANPSYIKDVYKEVLKRANVSDTQFDDPRFVAAASMKVPVWPETQPDPEPDDAYITPDNREYILNEITVAIVSLVADVTKLQEGVLERIYSALLRNPEALDETGRKYAQDFLQTGLNAEESTNRLNIFYEYFNEKIRHDLEHRGYRFLDSTWAAVRLPGK